VLLTLLVGARRATAARIACVGDSITFGYGLADPSTQSYPAVLAAELGSAHTLENFGVSGATLLKNGDRPYWEETSFGASTSFDPDVVVIMLGTNDAKPQNWTREAEFAPDYLELIEHYRLLGALVYVATPPPVFGAGAFDISPTVVAGEVVPLVRTLAEDANAPLVDVFTALSEEAQNFPDTVHPNAAGAALIADAVAAALEEHGFGGAGMAAGAGGAAQGGRAGAGGRGATDAGAGPGGTAGAGASVGIGGASAGASSSGGLSGAASGGAPGGSGGGSAQAGMASALGGRSAATAGAAGVGTAGSNGAGTASSLGGAPALGGAAGHSGAASAGASGVTAQSSSPGEGGGCGCRLSRPESTPLEWWVSVVLAAAIGTRGSARRRSRARTPCPVPCRQSRKVRGGRSWSGRGGSRSSGPFRCG
jgi:lysophospholipase L1-like esterase